MKDERADEAQGRLEELPHVDPIAYLGTERHPLSAPPTGHDVELPAKADPPPRSRWFRRAIAIVLAGVVLLPLAASFSSDDESEPAPVARPATLVPPTEPAQPAGLAAPRDLPPGGLSESATSAGAMSEERSVADWTDAPPPRATTGRPVIKASSESRAR